MSTPTESLSNGDYPIRLGHFVGGEWNDDQRAEPILVRNPCNVEQVVGSVGCAGPEILMSAAESASAAFEEWRELPARARGELMQAAADALHDDAARIGRVVADELGRPTGQAVKEVYGAVNQLRYYAHEAVRWRGAIPQSDHVDRQVLLLDKPVGVVLVISPWNNPLFILCRFAAPALAAGCTVIAKPPSEGPLSTLLLAEVLHKAGLPSGVLNVVTGRGPEVARELLAHSAVRKVAMTGGSAAGRALMAEAAKHLKPVALELGGQCPAIVCEDARLDTAADAITFQAFRQAGQVCNRVNRVYAHESIYADFAGMLRERVGRLRVGLVDDPEADYAALINQKQLDTAQRHVDDALAKGAKLETGGNRLEGHDFDPGYFFAPTLLSDCSCDMLVMKEETFGPVLGMTRYSDFDAALSQANDTPYGLAAYLFTQNAPRCYRAMHNLEVGNLWINDISLSYPQCPYGGCKASGIGRTQGVEVMREFMETTTVYWDFADYHRGHHAIGH